MTNPNDTVSAVPNCGHTDHQHCDGLTKREYFAAMAMQGLMDYEETGTIAAAEKELGIPEGTYNYQKHWPMILALKACAYSDALIAELNKEPK